MEWISVKDRLPEMKAGETIYSPTASDTVLVYMNGVTTARYFPKDGWGWIPAHHGFGWDVTHWMPLPESPQLLNP